jgi:hypothetical protein
LVVDEVHAPALVGAGSCGSGTRATAGSFLRRLRRKDRPSSR